MKFDYGRYETSHRQILSGQLPYLCCNHTTKMYISVQQPPQDHV